jgi:rhodanese-related sulfurtransferase
MNRFAWAASAVTGVSVVAIAAEHTKDSLDTVKKSVAEGRAILVDVREADEWKDGHLKDARHLALSEIKAGVPAERLKKVLPPGTVIYLHCAAGGRCKVAADLLQKQGYQSRPLKDGYENLLKAGFPQAK